MVSFRESRENHQKKVSAVYSNNKQNEKGGERENWTNHVCPLQMIPTILNPVTKQISTTTEPKCYLKDCLGLIPASTYVPLSCLLSLHSSIPGGMRRRIRGKKNNQKHLKPVG